MTSLEAEKHRRGRPWSLGCVWNWTMSPGKWCFLVFVLSVSLLAGPWVRHRVVGSSMLGTLLGALEEVGVGEGAAKGVESVERSKLSASLGSGATLYPSASHELCGEYDASLEEVRSRRLAVVVVTYKAPRSLEHSLRSWKANGLLDVADDLLLFANSPSARDRELAEEYGFRFLETSENGGNVMVGAALAALVDATTADDILFLEKDFELTADRATMQRELWNGVQHMARGVEVFRLRGKTDHPAEGMPDCCDEGDRWGGCPFHSDWRTAGSFADHMNWLYLYCDPQAVEKSRGRAVRCSNEPLSICFTSAESNWSNNPVLFPKVWFQERLRKIALDPRGKTDNRLFEFYTMLDWLTWHPPARICISYQGIFKHVEIDQ